MEDGHGGGRRNGTGRKERPAFLEARAPLGDAALEMGLVFKRLLERVGSLGLSGGEVEALIGLGIGEWAGFRLGRPGWSMTASQERRARLAIEMIDLLFDMHGSWLAVLTWLITPSEVLGDLTPLEWASERPEQLSAVVRTLRERRG